MRTTTILTVLLLGLMAWSAPAVADCGQCGGGEKAHAEHAGEMDDARHAAHHEMMQGMQHQQLVEHYAAIAGTLAEDSAADLSGHAMAMQKALTPKGAKEPMMGAASLATLQQKELTLEQAREAFTALSGELVPALKAHYPEGDGEWAVYHCDMAPGSWVQAVQAEGKPMNPYYGSKMLHCGKKVAVLGADEADEAESAHHGAH